MDDREVLEIQRAMTTMECPPYLLTGEGEPTRLQRAAVLVRGEKVVEMTPGVWSVEGSDRAYTVRTTGCECPASTKGKSKWCYHLVAVALWDRWQSRITSGYVSAFGQAPAAPAPLPSDDRSDTDLPTEDDLLATSEDVLGWQPEEPPKTLTPVRQAPASLLPLRNYRPIAAIIHDLSDVLPNECVAWRKARLSDEKATIPYLHWWDVVVLLDAYAPGWEGKIVRCEELSREEIIDRRQGTLATVQTCTVTYRLSIPCAEGIVSREAVGRESSHEPIPFGDLSSNASASALTRAAAMFGVGVWLREKDKTTTALRQYLLKRGYEAFGLACEHQAQDKEQALAGVLRKAGVTKRGEVPLWVLQRYGGRA